MYFTTSSYQHCTTGYILLSRCEHWKKGSSCHPLPEHYIIVFVGLVVPPCPGLVPDAGVTVVICPCLYNIAVLPSLKNRFVECKKVFWCHRITSKIENIVFGKSAPRTRTGKVANIRGGELDTFVTMPFFY